MADTPGFAATTFAKRQRLNGGQQGGGSALPGLFVPADTPRHVHFTQPSRNTTSEAPVPSLDEQHAAAIHHAQANPAPTLPTNLGAGISTNGLPESWRESLLQVEQEASRDVAPQAPPVPSLDEQHAMMVEQAQAGAQAPEGFPPHSLSSRNFDHANQANTPDQSASQSTEALARQQHAAEQAGELRKAQRLAHFRDMPIPATIKEVHRAKARRARVSGAEADINRDFWARAGKAHLYVRAQAAPPAPPLPPTLPSGPPWINVQTRENLNALPHTEPSRAKIWNNAMVSMARSWYMLKVMREVEKAELLRKTGEDVFGVSAWKECLEEAVWEAQQGGEKGAWAPKVVGGG